jgi:O-antigen ligase
MIVSFYFVVNYTGSAGKSLVAATTDRIFSLFKSETYDDPYSSLRWRDFEDDYALQQIASHPFIGIGLATKYRPWTPGRDREGFDGRNYIHSGFYWLLMRTGGIGFLLMMGIMVAAIIRGFRYWRIVPDNGAYVLGFTLAIIGMVLGNWVEPLISEWEWTMPIAIMIGLNELFIRSISLSYDGTSGTERNR